MRVDFMIIGAQKCATSSLLMQLATHPAIRFPSIRDITYLETGYFNQSKDWRDGLDKYHRLFRPEDHELCGEKCTNYTFLPETQGTYCRLYEYNPDLKLIYIMRQPVERIVSHFAHRLGLGRVRLPIEKAVFECPSYVNRSRYGVQIRPYLELFPRKQVMLLLFEEYIRNQQQTLSQIAQYLEIDPQHFAGTEYVHTHKSAGEWHLASETIRKMVWTEGFRRVRSYVPASIRQPVRRFFSHRFPEKPQLSPELRQTLWRLLEDDVCYIEILMGRRLDEWREGYDG